MPGFGQNLDHLARDLQLALQRLIGVGVGAERDGGGLILRFGEFRAQQRGRVVLGVETRFEIQARRKSQVGVARPREAVDAAVLAAPVGIDRAVEGNVGRLVAGDHAAAAVR